MKTLADIKFYINRFKHNSLNYIETILIESGCFTEVYSEELFICRAKGIKFKIFKNKIGFKVQAKKGKRILLNEVM
jgi:hypothetical protein